MGSLAQGDTAPCLSGNRFGTQISVATQTPTELPTPSWGPTEPRSWVHRSPTITRVSCFRHSRPKTLAEPRSMLSPGYDARPS